MPKLLYASASPYSAKVRMAAAYAGVPLDAVIVDTNQRPAELIQANPLGKIPTLITDEGEAMFDSRAITQHLNRVSGNALFPRNAGQARRGRAAGGAGRRHLRLPARPCLRAPQPAGGKMAPALARQAMGQGRPRARPPHGRHAEAAAQADRGTHRAARHARLPRSAVSRTMGTRAGQTQALGGALRRTFPELAAYLPS